MLTAEVNHRRELTGAQRALINQQLALIPLYLWLAYGWFRLASTITNPQLIRDFAHFYIQGVVASAHDSAALYDMERMAAIGTRVLPDGGVHRFPPVYGPQMSVLFSPFAGLSYMNAMFVWLALSLGIYAVCCYATWRACPRLRTRKALTFAVVAAMPALHYTMSYAQISAIGLACFTAAYFAFRANRPMLAGLALGSLAYKPPLALAAAVVLLAAGEWRVIAGGIIAAAAQLAVGIAFWGWPILVPYGASLLRIPGLAAGMEAHEHDMHSWRAFFQLLDLPAPLALAAYVVLSAITLGIAIRCWRASGDLALRYSTLLIATVLVDPHLFVYDRLVLAPALLLLWDWSQRQEGSLASMFPRLRSSRIGARPYAGALECLLYAVYLSPLVVISADVPNAQLSVLMLAVLGLVVANHIRRSRGAPVVAET